jgi:hypothetical protein
MSVEVMVDLTIGCHVVVIDPLKALILDLD